MNIPVLNLKQGMKILYGKGEKIRTAFMEAVFFYSEIYFKQLDID